MNIPTIPGQYYVVTSTGTCTVTADINGITYTLCTASAGQAAFCAPVDSVTISDATAIVTPTFKAAPTLATTASGGGSAPAITVDSTYDPTSANPQAGTAVANAFTAHYIRVKPDINYGISFGKNAGLGNNGEIAFGYNAYSTQGGIAIGPSTQVRGDFGHAVGHTARAGTWATAYGKNCYADSIGSVAIGNQTEVTGEYATALGYAANATGNRATALGTSAKSKADLATALGYAAKVADTGVCCIAAWNSADKTLQTLLYLIGSGSALATTYETGAASLGYVVKASIGTVLECGTVKLRDLLPNNTAFAPAVMDLDAPAPTPFLPTGITEPIEFLGDTPIEEN